MSTLTHAGKTGLVKAIAAQLGLEVVEIRAARPTPDADDPHRFLEVEDADGSVWGFDLAGWAAEEAAKILARNWADFVRDGGDVRTALHDVDDTCAVLKRWEAAVRADLEPDARLRTTA